MDAGCRCQFVHWREDDHILGGGWFWRDERAGATCRGGAASTEWRARVLRGRMGILVVGWDWGASDVEEGGRASGT